MLANQIAITAEYLPSSLNIQADWQPKNHKYSSDWKWNLKNIFSDCANQRNTSNRPILILIEPSVTKIHVLASGPRRLCSRFSSALLWKPLRSCIVLNRKGTCQSKAQSLLIITTPTWQTMVRNIIPNVSSASHNSTQSDHFATIPSEVKAPFAGSNPTTVGGIEGFRKGLQDEVVSKLCGRPEAVSNYQLAWCKWARWFYERKVSPFASNKLAILNFPAFLFEKVYVFSLFNSLRSEISAYYVHIDNNLIGKNPRVCTLMKGIFNTCPPTPG